VNSIVACCHSAKLCALAARAFPIATQERYIASLGILDSVADQDLTKDPSAIANVVLHFPHLVLEEEQLEDISIV